MNCKVSDWLIHYTCSSRASEEWYRQGKGLVFCAPVRKRTKAVFGINPFPYSYATHRCDFNWCVGSMVSPVTDTGEYNYDTIAWTFLTRVNLLDRVTKTEFMIILYSKRQLFVFDLLFCCCCNQISIYSLIYRLESFKVRSVKEISH